MADLKKIFSVKEFIDKPENYSLLKEFWKALIKEIIDADVETYIHNFYGNGKEILDGNPILSTLIKNNKAIRIIQLENDLDEPLFASWTDKISVDKKEVEELVISLQLNVDTYTEIKNLIILFSTDALTSSILNGINEKYDAKWNLGKLSNAVHKANYNQVFDKFRSVYEPSLKDKNFKLIYFKRFHLNYVRYPWHAISFIGNSPLHVSYKKFVKSIDLINGLVSINQSIDWNTLTDENQYIVLISDKTDYISKLHSYTEEAEKEFDYLKDVVPSGQ